MSHRAHKLRAPLLSVVLAVGDDEETVGYRVRALVDHLREKQIPFEILAVNAGSRDNSFAVLALLAKQERALRLLPKAMAGKAFLRGASEAQGEIVALLEAAAPLTLAPLGWAVSRVAKGRNAVLLRGRYVVARRLTVLPVLVDVGGPSPFFERAFERACERATAGTFDPSGMARLLIVGKPPESPVSLAKGRLLAPLLRLLAA